MDEGERRGLADEAAERANGSAYGAGGFARVDAELAADGDDLGADGAAGFDWEALLGWAAREEVGLEGGGSAQGAGDAGMNPGAVGGAEAGGEEAVVRAPGLIQGGGELAAAADDPVGEEKEKEPAGDGEQTVFACRWVGRLGGLCRGGHGAGEDHAIGKLSRKIFHDPVTRRGRTAGAGHDDGRARPWTSPGRWRIGAAP